MRHERGTQQPLMWLWGLSLFLLPVISGMGSTITVAGLAPVRPFAVGLALIALAVLVFRMARATTVSWAISILALLWLGWGLFQPPTAPAISELSSIALGLVTTWALVLRSADDADLRWFSGGWIFAWLVSVLPGVYEIVSGRHLSNYLLGSPEWIRMASTDIASFFVNPNLFAYFLAVSMVMLTVTATRSPTKWVRRCVLSMVALTPVVVFYTGSRITTLVCMLILLWVLWAWWPGLVRRIILISGVVAAVAVVVAFVALPKLSLKLEKELSGSGNHRMNLYRNGEWMLQQTFGFGVGAGNFEEVIQVEEVPYATGGALNPHSGVFEIASQYGVVWTGVLAGLMMVLLWIGWRGFFNRFSSPSEGIMRQAVFVSAVALPVLSFANSTFLDSPIAWLHVASTAMVACSIPLRDTTETKGASMHPVEQVLRSKQRLRQAIAFGARES